MQSIRSKLEDVARKVKARMPEAARGMIERLETRVRSKRVAPTEAEPAPPADEPPPVAKPVRWELRSQAELVEHIEQHFHAGLRRELPRLIDGARRIERDHAGHASVPRGLTDLLETFASELESHMQKEERVLFPILRTGSRGGPVDMPIRMMEREHDSHADELAQIRTLTHDLAVPADASAAWQELYAGLAQLETELRQHIYLENNVLFARAIGGEY
ncbi:MAG TPA: hemerythrin domain-containing protein [Kofleriaceae bacterium]|nr:hemerythrin domain-containing protein [Kofleriaceae bacterium]